MNNIEKKDLREQIIIIIELLDNRLKDDPERPILNTLYSRYTKAKEILDDNGDVSKIMIAGSCRAYLDAFSDYMNPLLIEMDKAEQMLLKIK